MFCAYCGKQISDDYKFCPHCGKKTDGSGDPRPQGTPDGIRVIEQKDPLYRVECEYCRCVFEYKTRNLGFRPWYPGGFVYCPNCKKPIRHHLENEVGE